MLSTAEALINNKKAGEAFELLIAESERLSGTPEFDLLLGIAALDAGKPTQAVFALERVLALQPGNSRARAELARAYFEMGENEAAKDEFTTVKSQALPAEIANTIEKYLTAIESRFAATRTQFDVYLEAAFGYDSNVNSATDSSTVAIPAFGNLLFTLDDTGRELDSGFFQLGAGTVFSSPFLDKDNLRVFGNLNLREKITFNESDFRTRIANGQVGLRYTQGDNAFLASFNGQKYFIGGDDNRDLAGANIQWLHAHSEYTQFSMFASFAAQRFPDQNVRNVNQYSGGLGVVHALQHQSTPVLYASVYGGTDNERVQSRQDIGRDFIGVRLGGEYGVTDRSRLQGNISYQYSDYGGDDPLFNKTRQDHFVFIRAALAYSLTDNWSITPELQYIHNDSNILINDFDRWLTLITVRTKF